MGIRDALPDRVIELKPNLKPKPRRHRRRRRLLGGGASTAANALVERGNSAFAHEIASRAIVTEPGARKPGAPQPAAKGAAKAGTAAALLELESQAGSMSMVEAPASSAAAAVAERIANPESAMQYCVFRAGDADVVQRKDILSS